MAKPIPISDIYQPTEIIVPSSDPNLAPEHLTFEELLKLSDAVILAGPGRGKTTLLHWAYVSLSTSKSVVPVLFTLRMPDATKELVDFVEALSNGRSLSRTKGRIVLLVDGYDEIAEDDRKEVSKALMVFQQLDLGRFYLTCRSFYDIYDLKALHCELGPFSRAVATRYVGSFAKAYGAQLDAEVLLQELDDHGFQDFASHPLMLTLVCILKSGPNKEIPRRSIGLIRRALDTLAFRWDEAKIVARNTAIPLDGEERVRCLMRIAYEMPGLEGSWEQVKQSTFSHLRLIQVKGVEVRKLLMELAQWYGMLIPVDPDTWTFVHRTIQDYLAARFWVDSGGFGLTHITSWDMRAAYATCFLPDATDKMRQMLRAQTGLPAFRECLYNGAPFNTVYIAEAVVERVARKPVPTYEETERGMAIHLEEDFYELCSDEFLKSLVLVGGKSAPAGISVAMCALSELNQRHLKISLGDLVNRLQVFYTAKKDYLVEVNRSGHIVRFRLSDVVMSPK